MPNTLITNKLTDLVALRFLVNAGFVTVGAKEHFKDQMVGKRNGQTYTFVIRDAGEAIEGGEGAGAVDITSAEKTITERQVQMSLRDFVVPIETSAIEAVTDMNWDKEVAEPNGAKLANKVIRSAVNEAITQANVAIVGEGFSALAEVAAYFSSISNEKMYGFINPMIQAVLTSNGQQFNPVGSPDSFYSKGLLGTFHSVEYRGQRFMPSITVPSITLGKTANSDTWVAVDTTDGSPTKGMLCMNVTLTAPGSAVTIKKGTPIFIEGAMVADLIGDATPEQFAFIVSQDVPLAADAETAKLPIMGIAKTADEFTALLTGKGARAIVQEDNTSFANIAALKNTNITTLAAGKYWMGQVRLDGAYEFCTLDKLDSSNAESKLGAVEGIKVHENRVINNNNLTNTTRWDVVAMFGNIEKRGVANIYVKQTA